MTRVSVARRALGVLALGGLMLAASPMAAHADVVSDGLWYFDVLNVQDAHDAGFTGAGVTVAVIDSPVNLDIPTLRDARVHLGEQPDCFLDAAPVPVESAEVEKAGHGTNVVSLIAGTGAENGVKGVAPGADVLYYRVLPTRDAPCQDAAGADRYEAVAEAIDSAVDAGARIISISLALGPGYGIKDAITRALAHEVIVVAGMGNQDGATLLPPWSAFLNGGVSVQAIDKTGAVATHEVLGELRPNLDPDVDVAAPGVGILYQGTPEEGFAGQRLADGTSFATPIVSGFLAVTAQKYPEATNNQLLQSLIHNTGDGDHPLEYDPNEMFGYGFASLTSMLRADPTQYPDVNPFIIENGEPLAAEIDDARPTPTPAEPGPTESGDAFPAVAVIGGVVGGVAVVGVVVVIVALIARSRRVKSDGN